MKGRANRHTVFARHISLFLFSVVGLCALALVNGSAFAAEGPGVSRVFNVSGKAENPKYYVEFTSPNSGQMPNLARSAVASALNKWSGRAPEKNTFLVIDVRWEDGWGIATVTSAKAHPTIGDQESHFAFDDLFLVLVVKTGAGWQAALDSDADVQSLLEYVPTSRLDTSARNMLFHGSIPRPAANPLQQYNDYRFPWPSGRAWRVTQGWHDPTTWGYFPANNSIDFAIPGGGNDDILTSAPGIVSYMCTDANNVLVIVQTTGTSEYLGYLHLDPATVQQEGITVGLSVNRGRKLGRMKEGSFSLITCGSSTGAHIHMYFPTRPFTIDGQTFTTDNVHAGENLYSTQGSNATNTPTRTPTRTPTSISNPTNTPTRTPTPDPSGAWSLTSPSYNVNPNQQVQVSVQLHSNTYTFLTSNSLLDSLDTQRYGAYQFQPLGSNVYPGQSYTFNRPDMFTMTSPSQPGTYTVRWQMRVGGTLMGPISTVTLIVGQGPPTPTAVPPGTWHVQAYANQNLAGSPCYDANETIGSYVFKDWDWSHSPGGSCPPEHWSVRLTKQVSFSGGNYSFHCEHDDGCRVYIDGNMRIDAWWDGTGGHDWGGNIGGGNHEVKVEFYNNTGLGRVEVWWRGPGALPDNDSGDPSQWYADYYGIHAIWGTSAIGLRDGSGFVSHDWRGQGNSPGFGLPAQNWAARFSRTVALACGTYRFTVTADDGVRLEVNGQALFDYGGGPPGTRYADASIAGGNVPITVFYYQAGGDAYVSMDWQLLSACPTATPAPVPPTADFDAWPQSGDAPLTVSMHNISTGEISSCSWDYGDGTTGTSCAAYHDHVYTTAGSYTVSLTLTGPGGSDSMTRTGYINVTVPNTNTPTFTATNTPLPTQTPGGPSATTVPTNTSTHTPTDTPIPGVTSTACPIQFTDVPEGSTFYAFVRCLACRGIINGYADGTFRPNKNVTRGQLSKLVSNAAGFSEAHTEQTFQDVAAGSTFYDFIARLASRGIIAGYACGGSGEPCVAPDNLPYFRPNANVTRGQTSKIVAIAEGLPTPPAGQQTFQDVPEESTFWSWIESLAGIGAINGYQCGGNDEPCVPPGNLPYFHPSNNVTRGQASKIVANTFFPACNP